MAKPRKMTDVSLTPPQPPKPSTTVAEPPPSPDEPLPPLTPLQEKLIAQHIETADRVAYAEWSKARHALDLEDLKATSYLGLVKAARRWYGYAEENGKDPNATQYFFTFSRLFMKGAIIDAMRKDDWATRSLRQKSKKLRAAGQDRGASVEDMSAHTGMSSKDINETIHGMSQRPVSLEAEEIDAPVIQSVESSVLVTSLLEALVSVIMRMDPVTQTILALHYYQERELQDIAKILGITDHRSSELHTNSVIKIRAALAGATLGRTVTSTEDS